MRILYLATDGFGGHGGIALYNRDMLEALSRASGVTAIDAVPRITGPFDEQLPPKVTWHGEAAKSSLAYMATALKCAAMLGRGDLIYCAHVNLMPIAAAIRALRGAPVALMLYGIEAWQPPEGWARKASMRAVDHILSISYFTLDRFLAWSGVDRAKSRLFPNAIRLEDYGEAPRDPALVARYGLAGRKVLLIFGRMHPTERRKGFDELLDALPEILEREPRAVILFAGDGGDRSRLEAKARELGLADAVRFTGMVDEREKPAIYRLADGYIMPSYQEGFGYVHLEAMACGVPTVASDLDGSREAVREGALGPMIDPHDRAAIVDAALEVLERPHGIPAGLNYFSFEQFVSRVAEWLDDIERTPAGAGAA